jgi:hypothetical protein
MEEKMEEKKQFAPEVESVIDQILTFVNRMPLDKDGRKKLASKLIEEHLTTNIEEAWKEPIEEKKE